jgi:hypothetical protein
VVVAGNLKEAILGVVLAVVTIASAASSIVVVGKEYNVCDGDDAAYKTVRMPSDEDTTGIADDKLEGRL